MEAAVTAVWNFMMSHRTYIGLLTVLLGVFLFRVVAQFVQWVYPVGFLPPFDEWQSGVLPYPVLLLAQIAVLSLLIVIVTSHANGRHVGRRRRGIAWMSGGGVYFGVMALRLVASDTFAAPDSWLGATIPSFFHLVLACFLLLHGYSHLRCAKPGE